MEENLATELLLWAWGLWALGTLLALSGFAALAARLALAAGAGTAILAALIALPAGTDPLTLPVHLAGMPVQLQFAPAALWLMGFGLCPALLACALATPLRAGRNRWLAGAGVSLLGAFGVFGFQDAVSFLIAWELMSLGAAIMLLGEHPGPGHGRPVLFMLALLEVGSVALLMAMLLLGRDTGSMNFADFASHAAAVPGLEALLIGLLLVAGFGAKLGLLPFYEWFPTAYASGSGASGAIMSGVVLNAAFFGLGRALLAWLPATPVPGSLVLAVGVVAAGVFSAILAILYAFQQEDWRALLAFSSAENAAVAVSMLGASLLFEQSALPALAALAWVVALLHLAAHALSKGGLFLGADGAYQANRGYAIVQSALLRRSPRLFGLGALLAVMSLAALPPLAGFVSEWFVFQTVFQGFHLPGMAARLTLALAGGGLALTAAIALATFAKLFGIALLGDGAARSGGTGVPRAVSAGVFTLGALTLALAVGMPYWLGALQTTALSQFGVAVAGVMRDGVLLVPLTARFAFISPTMLIVAMPLLALLPLGLLWISGKGAVRRVPVWYGGLREDTLRAATTALSFSNALRTFYSFVYRPVLHSEREHRVSGYFLKRLTFNYRIAPLFGPYLFSPATRLVWRLAGRLRALQSGDLNFYLALIGALLVGILGLSLLR